MKTKDAYATSAGVGSLDPLFIPLQKGYFEAFERGQHNMKVCRKYSPRWNERNCIPGRRVVLSCGVGKQRRLTGIITSFWKRPIMGSDGRIAFSIIYGLATGYVAEIGVNVSCKG